MAKRITELTSATSLAETDVLPIVDVSDTTQATSGTTKKLALSLIADYLKARVETLTNKTLDGNNNTLKHIIPAGSITMYGGSTAPTGYLLCDGSAVSRTTYADLFTAIGTTYGTGDGSTTFNVPNVKGKVPVGRDSGDTSFDTLGETGGAKTHTLSVAEMPPHSHAAAVDGGSGGSMTAITAFDYNRQPLYYVGTNSNGSGNAHNNLQPYIVFNYIIKT